MSQSDAIIVGGGHNGLVTACYLAKAGLEVTVLERRDVVGGAAVTEEVWPGFRVSVAAFTMSLLQPRIMIDLDLRRHGIEIVRTPAGIQQFSGGRCLTLHADTARMAEEIRPFSPHDAEAYPRFVAHMDAMMPVLRRLIFETPVDPSTGRIADIARTLRLAWRMRDAGPRFYDVWDLLTLSAVDFLRRWFESDVVLTMLGCYASGSGGNMSPRTPGSAYVLARPLLRDPATEAGPGGLPVGGMGAVTQALLKAARELGVDVRTNAEVARIEVQDGRAREVVLTTGERLGARVIAASLPITHLYGRLIEPQHLPPEVLDRTRRVRTESSCFKINLATEQPPRWTGFDQTSAGGSHPGSVTIAESIGELEEAFEAARHGRMAERPYLWIMTPSVFDPSVAPPGRHTVSVFGGHVPYRLAGREWDDEAREELYHIVMRQICRFAPGFDNSVIHKQVLVPQDIERIFALPGGHVHHGEMSLDQIFFRRPFAHHARYRSPIANLYICGASAHPGGGVTGVPGHNAAREILRDLRVR
ncbi:MAG: NAD(P)/FAD-dependent oxidoreductase [Hyphomicrobiaceae bacterium]